MGWGIASILGWQILRATDQSQPSSLLLDFTATWCHSCQQMNPIVASLQRQGYPIRKVDIDRERALAEQFRVRTLPTFILIVNGQEVMRRSGALPESELKSMLLRIPAWERELAKNFSHKSRDLPTNSSSPSQDSAAMPSEVSPFRQIVEELVETPAGRTSPASSPSQQGFDRGGLLGNSSRNHTGRDLFSSPAGSSSHSSSVVRGQSREEPSSMSNASSGQHLLRVTTRLKVRDAKGTINFGSGSILDSRPGQALILTCGHLLRGLDRGAKIEVDLFDQSGQSQTYPGEIIDYDLQADVGLVKIPLARVYPMVRIAREQQPLKVGDTVLALGCGGGDSPTIEQLAITALNRYEGPDNVECTGMPARGRSGGGLFLGDLLVGVCIAADPQEKRGLYCGLRPIHDLLKKNGYQHLLERSSTNSWDETPTSRSVQTAASSSVTRASSPLTKSPARQDAPAPIAVLQDDQLVQVSNTPHASRASQAENLTAPEPDHSTPASELAEMLRHHPDAEIICIVRPRHPNAVSRVIIFPQASPRLLSYLNDGPVEPSAGSETAPSNLVPTSQATSSRNQPAWERESFEVVSIPDKISPSPAVWNGDKMPYTDTPTTRSSQRPRP